MKLSNKQKEVKLTDAQKRLLSFMKELPYIRANGIGVKPATWKRLLKEKLIKVHPNSAEFIYYVLTELGKSIKL